jgi:hypothetical protein
MQAFSLSSATPTAKNAVWLFQDMKSAGWFAFQTFSGCLPIELTKAQTALESRRLSYEIGKQSSFISRPIPPKFAAKPPINPTGYSERSFELRHWRAAEGLAEDVRYYGQWVRGEAQKRIGHSIGSSKLRILRPVSGLSAFSFS